jgi:hypothetical protein
MQGKNSLERDVQERFLDILKNQKENKSSNAFQVYQKLVYYRYEEIIRNTFAYFIKYISSKELKESIYKFLKNPPKTQFVWKIANDYRKFVKEHKLFKDRSYLYELLYFEWIEVELYMKEYKEQEEYILSWENSYKIAKSARIKKFKYDIIGSKYEEERENYLIIYVDFENNKVLYREINQFIYVLIKRLKQGNIEQVLEQLCIENEIELEDAKNILQEPIKELILNKALARI